MDSKSRSGNEPDKRPGLPPPPCPEPHPPTVENLKLILLRALESGCVVPSVHFGKRCAERGFFTPDAEILIEEGSITDGPSYVADHHSFQFEVQGRIDGRQWNLVAALDCNSDFIKSPRVTLVTVHRKRLIRVQRK